MGFGRADIPLMMMRNKDRASRVMSLTNEKPLGIVKMCINVVWEVI